MWFILRICITALCGRVCVCSIKPAVCVQCSGVLPNVLSQRTILTLAHRVLKTSNAIDELSVLL